MTATFTELVEEYLAMRRGLGYKLARQGDYLRDFAGHLDRTVGAGPVPLATSVAWAKATAAPDPRNPARRLVVVRGFLCHLAALDEGTEVPPVGFLGPTCHRRPPHVYTDEELASLLRAAASLSPKDGLRPHCYVTLFSLLACTGLRISEALALVREDVDLGEGVVVVRAGKGGRSRLVPLHESAREPLRAYGSRCARLGAVARSDAFFRTEHHDRLPYRAVQYTFNQLRRELRWNGDGRTRPPRIHDLRHRMVVQRVLTWHADGANVDVRLPALGTYLGHAQVSDLYWYFSATPELMGIVAERFSSLAEEPSDGAR